MKKHLIAAAVAAAVAVPAMAQVTVSGNVEAAYGSASKSGFTQSGVLSGVIGTPTIRFSGSEDLGGGLKASFQLDIEHNTANGLIDTSSAASTAPTAPAVAEVPDLAVSTVSLSGGFGSVTLGKSAFRSRDGGGLYRFFGNAGRLVSGFNSSDEVTNLIEYVSPAIQGFSVSYGFADAGRTAVGAASARQDGMTLRGALGPVNFQYGLESQRVAQAANAAASLDAKRATLAANVNLNVARVGLVYAEVKSAAAAPATTRAMGVHTAIPMGKAITLGGNYTNYKVANTDGKTDIFALVAQYDFSKRTKLYGTYQSVAAGTVGGGTSSSRGLGVSEVAGATRTGYAVSVVHSF